MTFNKKGPKVMPCLIKFPLTGADFSHYLDGFAPSYGMANYNDDYLINWAQTSDQDDTEIYSQIFLPWGMVITYIQYASGKVTAGFTGCTV